MSNIDWTRLVPILSPLIVFGAWLLFSKFDKRADAVSKLIAIAEPIPAIDLNVPKPVVLASLYHSLDQALDILGDVIDFLQDVDIPSAKEIIDDIKDEIIEPLDPILEPTKDFLDALSDCRDNAKKNLGFTYPVAGPFWIVSCMQQKGFKITIDYVKDKFF